MLTQAKVIYTQINFYHNVKVITEYCRSGGSWYLAQSGNLNDKEDDFVLVRAPNQKTSWARWYTCVTLCDKIHLF